MSKPPMQRNIRNGAAVQGAEQRIKCLQLRKLGLSYQEIGDQLGISRQQAHKHVWKALDQYAITTEEEVAEAKATELARLDGMLKGHYPKAMAGHVGSAQICLKINERRSKLLGLDAPTKIAPTSPDGDEAWDGLGGGIAGLLKD